jgi:hypothetical protein
MGKQVYSLIEAFEEFRHYKEAERNGQIIGPCVAGREEKDDHGNQQRREELHEEIETIFAESLRFCLRPVCDAGSCKCKQGSKEPEAGSDADSLNDDGYYN